MGKTFAGQCLCGSIQFSIEAPTLWCGHCHCSLCRRAHGAAFVTWVGADEQRFELGSGSESLVWYRSTPDSQRGFCSQCGSTLFFRSDRWPGEMHVVLSNIDDDIDRQPEGHVYWESHASWVEMGDSLPRKCIDGSG